MRKKVLIIHHLETMWEDGYKKFGTCLEELVVKIHWWLRENEYSFVLLTRFEDNKLEQETLHLERFVNDVREYAYGWSSDMFADEDEEYFQANFSEEFVEGGNHSELVWIPDWLHSFADCDVDLCGAFIGECLEDMEIALNAIGVQPNYLHNLCVG